MLYQTLYATNDPDEIPRAEYYEPQLEMQFIGDAWRYFVREKHGWFDTVIKEHVHIVSTLNPKPNEGFSSYEEARQKYDERVQHRATQGYVHSFTVDPTSPDGVWYREIRPD